MIGNITEEQYTKAWKDWNGSFLQSWQWGEVKSESWDAARLGFFRQEELVGIATVLIRSFPLAKLTRHLGLKKIAYIPRGFCVKDENSFGLILQDLDEYLQKEHISVTMLDPESDLFEPARAEKLKKELERNRWKKAGTTIQPNQSNIIRIDKQDSALWGNISPKWRRNINKAKRQGVQIVEFSKLEDVNLFYDVLREVASKGVFKIHKLGYFRKIWDELCQKGLGKIYAAKYLPGTSHDKEEVVSAYLVLFGPKVAYEVYGGVTSLGRELEASYLIKWEMMRKTRDAGKVYYDQWGIAPSGTSNHPLSGITYFKSGFGGRNIELLPQYIKSSGKISSLAYSLIHRRIVP